MPESIAGRVGIVWKGEYSSAMQYTEFDSFIYNGRMYVAKATAPIGTLPTNTTYFEMIIRNGDPITGPEGLKGLPGNMYVHSVYTVAQGQQSRVVNVGTDKNANYDFYLECGPVGATGFGGGR